MRSEIYDRIRQNKMKYYAELNTLKVKVTQPPVVENKISEVNIPVADKQPKEKSVLLRKVQEFDYKSMFKKVPDAVKTGYTGTVKSKAVTALKTQVKSDHEKIKQFSAKVNNKIDKQTDKIADRVYTVSSFLFEEQPKSSVDPDFSSGNVAVETIGTNTIEWSVDNEGYTTASVYDRIGEASEKTFEYLRSVPNRVKDYLASDENKDWNNVRYIARR